MNIKTISSAGHNFWADEGGAPGDTVYVSVPVCKPAWVSDLVGEKTLSAREVRPSIRSVRGFPAPINL